jgi:hypothetical protein
MKTRCAIAAAAMILASCAAPTQYSSTPAYNRYTLEDVVQWSKAGEAPQKIIAKLDEAHGFYPLRASDIIRLHEQGVSVPVLDYLLDTYLRRTRYEERFQMPSRFSEPR